MRRQGKASRMSSAREARLLEASERDVKVMTVLQKKGGGGNVRSRGEYFGPRKRGANEEGFDRS